LGHLHHSAKPTVIPTAQLSVEATTIPTTSA
jgi:hypothetical protein